MQPSALNIKESSGAWLFGECVEVPIVTLKAARVIFA
jgi:hypothetical protein